MSKTNLFLLAALLAACNNGSSDGTGGTGGKRWAAAVGAL